MGAGLLCFPAALFGLAVKGEEGRIPIGYEVKAYTDADYKVKIIANEQVSPAEEMKRTQEVQRQIEEEAEPKKPEKPRRVKEQPPIQ